MSRNTTQCHTVIKLSMVTRTSEVKPYISFAFISGSLVLLLLQNGRSPSRMIAFIDRQIETLCNGVHFASITIQGLEKDEEDKNKKF